MTSLNKPISRECPGIRDSEGRVLVLTIDPEGGGKLSLRWKGERGGAPIEVELKELAQRDAGAPKRWGTWVRVEDLVSQITTSPEFAAANKHVVLRTLDRICLHAKFMKSSISDWNNFLEKEGRTDLIQRPLEEDEEDSPTPKKIGKVKRAKKRATKKAKRV